MIQFTEKYRKAGDIELQLDQIEGVNFLLTHKGAILAFQTGLGKTLTLLTACKIVLDNFPKARVVIVAPVKAKKAFMREIPKLGWSYDDVGVIATDEFHYDIDKNKIFFFTDTNIEKYIDIVAELAAKEYKLVLAVDEAHKLADKSSKFYGTMTKVKAVSIIHWGSTATPLINDLDGLYNIVDFFCPGFLGKKTDFDNRYTKWHLETIYIKGGKKKKIRVLDGYKNLQELNTRLKQIIIVRSKQYNLKFSNQFRGMTDEESKVYETVSSGILGIGEDERNFSKRMSDLQRFIDGAYGEDESLKQLAVQSGAISSTKEEILVDTLKAALKQKLSVIIYTDYKDTVEKLHKTLKSRRIELGIGRVFEITGAIDIKTRESVEEKIAQNDIVIITSAGTESINLQRCSCVIFYDIPFSTKQIIQCVGRICRRDTKHPNQYIILMGLKDTIDEYKYLLFQTHLGVVQQALGIGNDLPLDSMGVDQKMIKELREKLLWKYRGDPISKKVKKQKKELKDLILVSSLNDAEKIVANNKFLIEPIPFSSNDIKFVQAISPEKEDYDRFIDGKIPFTVLRSHYLDKMRSVRGKELIRGLQTGVATKGTLLLVGNTPLVEALKQEILDQLESPL